MSETSIKSAPLNELNTIKFMRVQQDGRSLCLAYVDGEAYSIDDMCTHEEASIV